MASTATLFVGRGFVAFLVGIGIGRFLGPQGRGEVVFVVTAAALLAMVATAGVVPAIHRVAQTNPTVDLARSVLGVTVARVGAVLAVAGLAWFLVVQRWYSASAFQLACTAALCLLVGLQATLVATSAPAKKEVAASAWLLVGTSILLVAVVGLGIGDGLTSSIVWILWVLSQAVAVVAIFLHLFTPNGTADFGSVWRAAQSAGWGELLLSTTWRVDNLIIGLVVGIGALGRYSAAVAVAEVVLSLLNALRMVLLRQDLGDRTAVLVTTIRFTAVAAIPLTVLGAALGPWAIESTFGPSFSGLRTVLAIMIPSAMGLGLSFVLLDHAASSGKSRAAGVAAGTGLVVNVAANVILLPRFGIEGGAAASGLAYATTLGLLMRTLRGHEPSS